MVSLKGTGRQNRSFFDPGTRGLGSDGPKSGPASNHRFVAVGQVKLREPFRVQRLCRRFCRHVQMVPASCIALDPTPIGKARVTKSRSVMSSLLWAIIVIAFPVASGVLVVVSKADPTSSRLIQAAFMYASISIPLVYCKKKKISLRDIFLVGIDGQGVKASLYYLPLVVVLLPTIVGGVRLTNTGHFLATLLFTLGVGIAEELYFRGIILRILDKSLGPLPVVFISALIFGAGHASGAFVEKSLALVLLSILNALLFGWVAAETALLTKNLVPLMIFHCLFDFLTYQMLATGNAKIMAYAVRGALMTIVAVYLLIRLKQQPANNPDGSLEPLARQGSNTRLTV